MPLPTSEEPAHPRPLRLWPGVLADGFRMTGSTVLRAGPDRDREVAHVKTWIERAGVLGAPTMRIFAGNLQGRTQTLPLLVVAYVVRFMPQSLAAARSAWAARHSSKRALETSKSCSLSMSMCW